MPKPVRSATGRCSLYIPQNLRLGVLHALRVWNCRLLALCVQLLRKTALIESLPKAFMSNYQTNIHLRHAWSGLGELKDSIGRVPIIRSRLQHVCQPPPPSFQSAPLCTGHKPGTSSPCPARRFTAMGRPQNNTTDKTLSAVLSWLSLWDSWIWHS